jgi:multidrug efflux pump
VFSKFFIERPIFAVVVATLLTLAGAVSLTGLPVQQYPNITPVQVTVQATYPGADSRTLAESVAAPIETQINGVDNMLYMSSTSSSNGQMTLTVYFSLDTDPDIAQVQVQNRVNLATPQLPAAVVQQGVNVQKKSSSIMMLVAVYASDGRYSPDYVANYANVYVLDALKRVQGAGQAQVMGVANQAMRIWMNPDRMASLEITTTDIQNAIAAQNALFGAGQVGQQPTAAPVELSFPVITQRPFTDPKQYEKIILRASQDGSAIVRVGDVARAAVGLQQYVVDSRLDNQPATFIAVYQQAGANGLVVSDAVRKTLADMKSRFPDGIEYAIALDTNDFVRISIKEVIHTLVIAVILVVLVVYLFLQSLRTTFICAVAIVVALVTTFAGMLALGFSINLLTLFGLVLAIGMVVDDAIVVVENVERIMAKDRLDPKAATIKSMNEIGSSLVAVVLVMASVFVPAAFLPGTTGQLYKQFAITIVVSVAVSGFTALTLTPAMCAVLLRHSSPPQRGPFAWFNRQVDRVTGAFGHAVTLIIKRMAIALVLLAGFLYSIFHLFTTLPTSFVPNEDQGYAFALIIMPDAASLDRTAAVAERVDAMLAKIPGVERRSAVSGYSLLDSGFKQNAATFFITFRDFEARYATLATAKAENARAILTTLYREVQSIEGATIFPVPPPAIPGIGTTGGFEFWVQDTTAGEPARLDELTQEVIRRAGERRELAGLHTTFRSNTPQLRADVDRDKATLLGVPIEDVYSAIQAQFGSIAVSQFMQYSQVWWVILQSDAKYRQAPDDLTRLYTRTNKGQRERAQAAKQDQAAGQSPMVPLSALVTTSWITGPDLLPHFNGFPAAKINGNAAPGYSSGQAIAAMEEIAREVLPQGYTFAWSGLAFEEKKSGGTSMIAFVFGLIIVFLVLAAQYESWSLPGAVMTAVPFGILGALTAIALRGLENDVYFQIGLLVLIGLGAKNAVLRVTAAVELRKQGKSIMEATIEAGEQRLRPIIMTSLAFAFGVLPLAIAVGAGANARHSIGTGILGGMLGETTLAMLYVPLFFYLFDRLNERSAAKKEKAAAAARGTRGAPTGGAAAARGTRGAPTGGAAAAGAAPAGAPHAAREGD